MIETFGDELVLTLRKPIKLGDLEFSTITLSEPNGEQLQKGARAASEPWGQVFTLIAETGGVPIAVPKRMLQRDLERALDFFAHFSVPTGPESSASSQPK